MSEPAPDLRHIVILGLMGAGKTTVGAALAGRLDWPLRDSDECILEATGSTVGELQRRHGTEYIHRLEADHVLTELAGSDASVIAAAASIVDSPACREALETAPDTLVVWLAVDPAALAKRFATRRHRPLYGADPEQVLRDQLTTRAARLAEVADVTLRTTDWTVADTVTAILARARASA